MKIIINYTKSCIIFDASLFLVRNITYWNITYSFLLESDILVKMAK